MREWPDVAYKNQEQIYFFPEYFSYVVMTLKFYV